jgi:4-amino-4-deoxy-L-arabinose transferase-like glycosyltransferase
VPQELLIAGWLLAQVGFLAALLPALPRVDWSRRVVAEAAAVALIVLATLVSRLWNNGDIPLAFHGDLASNAMQARDILAWRVADFFGIGYGSIPIIGFLPSAFSIALFGDSIAGVNVVSAIGAAAAILALYLLARELFGWRVALFAALLGTGDLVLIAWGRVSNFIDPVPLEAWSFYLLVRGLRRGGLWPFALAGLLAGLATNMHYAGRIAVPQLLVFLAIVFAFRPRLVWQYRGGLAALAIGILLALGPTIVYDLHNWDVFMSRARAVSLFTPQVWTHTAGKYHIDPNNVGAIIWTQFEHASLFFWRYRDASTQAFVNRNMLDPVAGTLFMLGLGYAAMHLRRPTTLIFLAWIGMYILSNTLTVDPPGSHKSIALALPVAILGAIALERCIQLLARPLGIQTIGIVVGVLLIFIAANGNWTHYLADATDLRYVTPAVHIGRFLIEQPPQYEVRLVSRSIDWGTRELRYFAKNRPGQNVPPDTFSGQIASMGSQATVVIFTPEAFSLEPELIAAFPSSRVVDGSIPPLTDVFHAVFID